MKIKFIVPILALAALSITACNPDRLEIPQKGVVSIDSYYQTDEHAEAAMVAAYQGFLWNVSAHGDGAFIYIPYRELFNMPGDDILHGGSNYGDNDYGAALNEFRFDSGSEVVRNVYNGFYYALYYSNLVIDKFGSRTDATTTMKRVVAEARVLRAYIHMMLAAGWGTPPRVDHVLAGSDNPYNCNTDPENPMTREQLLEWCAEECLAAVPDLDERQGTGDKDGAVKVTKGFANAVAGKAYVYAGAYDKAVTCLKAVIDSGNYELVDASEYEDLFHIEGDCNAEKVFETNLEINPSLDDWSYKNRNGWMDCNYWNWRSDHFRTAGVTQQYSGVEGWGALGVPKALADEFIEYHDENSVRLETCIVDIEEVCYEWPFGNETLDNMTREQRAADSTLVGLNNLGLYGNSFYLALKPLAKVTDMKSVGDNSRLNNFTYMRYAEVLLLYTEACIQTGRAADALPYFQALQNRAGVKDEYKVQSAADLTMDALKTEKKFEMWMENCRFLDIVRWGDTSLLTDAGSNIPILYDKTSRAPQPGDKNIIWQHGSEDNSRFYTVQTSTAKDLGFEVGFKTGKHELFPFPYTVTSINPNITQNPGW